VAKLIYSFLPLGNHGRLFKGGLGTGGAGLLSFGAIILMIDKIKFNIIDINLFKANLSRNFIYKLQYDIMVIHHISC
jgi:hypothetical protein